MEPPLQNLTTERNCGHADEIENNCYQNYWQVVYLVSLHNLHTLLATLHKHDDHS